MLSLTDPAGPTVVGCKDCDSDRGGVPDRIVRWWPEAWRKLAEALDDRKKAELTAIVG